MRVLLVTRNSEQLRALTEVFRGHYQDLALETAASALFALTRLEREVPDLIVSAGDVGMSGAEFLEIVRADALIKLPFILLDETALTHLTPGAHEIILERRTSPAVVLGAATSLLARRAEDEPVAALESYPQSSRYVQGTTGLVSPFDLLTLLEGKGTTGQLTFKLGDRAAVYLDAGQLVHAEYGPLGGEAALVAMFRALQLESDVHFEFRSGARAAVNLEVSPTLAGPLQVLLLRVALEVDRERPEER